MTVAPTSRRVLLKDVAFEEIKTLILEGTYPSGSFISEGELAERLEMSKTPIRSALERLAELGFVSISPQRGIVVRELSIQEITDHYDIRIALEGFVARCLANSRLDDDQIEQLRTNLATQYQQASDHNIGGYMKSDGDFHLTLAELLGNQEILRVMRHQREKLARVVQQIGRRDVDRLRVSADEHAAIVDAIVAGDAATASQRLIAHIENGKQLLLNSPNSRIAITQPSLDGAGAPSTRRRAQR